MINCEHVFGQRVVPLFIPVKAGVHMKTPHFLSFFYD